MPNWLTSVWVDLETAITNGWPDVTRIYRETQMRRLHWLNEVVAGTLTPPWSILQITRTARDTSWGAGQIMYRLAVEAYWCGPIAVSAGDTLDAKMMALHDYILGRAFNSFFIPDDAQFVFDSSPENRAMQLLLEGNIPYVAGSLTFEVLSGYIN